MNSPLPLRTVQRVVTTVLKKERVSTRRRVNVIFVDNAQLRRLSKRFLQKNHNTDVIAFPYKPTPAKEKLPLGDVYVSIDQARINARRFDVSLKQELIRLVVHGTLHLLGYSDHGTAKKARMWKKQEKLVYDFIH